MYVPWWVFGVICFFITLVVVVGSVSAIRDAHRKAAEEAKEARLLPKLSQRDCFEIGFRLGEANVLKSQWDAVWAAECLAERKEIQKRLLVPGENYEQSLERVRRYNVEVDLKDAEAEAKRQEEEKLARSRTETKS